MNQPAFLLNFTVDIQYLQHLPAILLIQYFSRLNLKSPYPRLRKLIMIYYKTYLLLLYFILFLNMTTTLLEPASIIAEEAGAELSSIFGL